MFSCVLIGAQVDTASPQQIETLIKKQEKSKKGKGKRSVAATRLAPSEPSPVEKEAENLHEEDEVEYMYTTLPKDLMEKRKELLDYEMKDFRLNTVPI